MSWSGQITFEEVSHVFLSENVALFLVHGVLNLLLHLVRYITCKQVFHFKTTLAFVFVSAFLVQPFALFHIFFLLHLYFLNYRGCFLLEFLFDVDVAGVLLVYLFVDDLLELVAASLRHQMHIESPLNKFVSFKSFDDLFWVIIVKIGCQVHILRVVHTGALLGLVVGNERNDLGA